MSYLKKASAEVISAIVKGEAELQNRKVLGPMIPVRLFQAVRMIGLGVAMEEMVGPGAKALVYRSGQRLGEGLGGVVLDQTGENLTDFVSGIQKVCADLRLGLVVVEKADPSTGLFTIRVDECVSCAGVQNIGVPICHFEAGLVGGILRSFVKAPVRAVETRCNAAGDSTCGIELEVMG